MMHEELLPDSSYDTSLAIVGMAGRFPGAPDVETLWQNITAGVRSIRFFSDEELLAAGVSPELLSRPDYVKAGTVLEDADAFDASFFQFSPREAEIMDPQHRLFLESAWQALEDAGYNPETYAGLIGVFSGSALSTYLLNNIYYNNELVDTVGKVQISIGNDRDSLSSTVSYKLNLRGPSFAVQTFCSTSLVAVHLACQSLLNYECDMALAGGVAIQFPQVSGYLYEEGGIVSPDGVCRTFDGQARGSVMGNGLAVVTLKRYEDALRDGDHMYALIRGSAINNDGNLRVSYTAPGLNGQSEVILQALGNANVPVETINYIEAHGTATMLGDTVELAAMKKAFAAHTAKQQFCAIGSLKPNIGHLDRASGVTGLIKTALALHHQQLPPSLNFESANPEVDLEHSPFYVNTKLSPWPATPGTPRRAGVSSFGIGGTNAHVVMEEAPVPVSGPARSASLLLLSAKSATALEKMSANLAAFLTQHPEVQLADVAYTLQVGRSAFNHRRMLVCQNRDEALRLLGEQPERRVLSTYQTRRDREPVLLLPAALPDARSLLRELAAEEPVVREMVEDCAHILRTQTGLDLMAALHADDETAITPALTRALLFVLEYALARLLTRWGLRFQALYGQGVGEYVAACLAGSAELATALLQALAPHLSTGGSARSIPAFQAPKTPWLSSLTGTFVTAQQASDPAYWQKITDHTPLAPLQESAFQALTAKNALFVEIGAGRSQLARQLAAHGESELLACFAADVPLSSGYARLLHTLGRLWLAGVTPDWTGFSQDEQRLRLSLPTYPFERQRYWIDEPGKATRKTPAQAGKPAERTANPADWFYQPAWEERPLAPLAAPPTARTWLLFEDKRGVSSSLAENLRAGGHEVICVRPGAAFAHPDEETFILRADAEEDYRALCQLLRVTGRFPGAVLHAWNVEPADQQSELTAQQWHGYYSLLFLSRALEEHFSETQIQTLVVATGLQQVQARDQVAPARATLLGACTVLAQEYLTFSYRSLDLDPATLAHAQLAALLLAEYQAPESERAVAYRQGRRYLQSYKPLHLEVGQLPLRQRGVYLITGGLGGIGMALADYLARMYQARLVLVGRSAFPARPDWSNWLTQHEP
ncbi:MAG TPA: type I polyketide synthase, partial [Ktedonobacteraceae bacterium]|nr:type I polyketide synthase [Ktedonobacteraceae bacterium]